jgi:hypothetical protein
MDFTLETYRNICITLTENYYTIVTVNDFLNQVAPRRMTAILRHDVDRRPSTALRMAHLEHQLGIKSTYYFRFCKGVFDPSIIKEIKAMGHEIGYHYETLSKCRGDMDKAISLFNEELEAFRQICPVHTASMHGRPLLPWDNRRIWQYVTPAQFNLSGECYLSIDYDSIQYFSDTGRTWHPGKYNIRDHVQNSRTPHLLTRSEELIRFLQTNVISNVCILTHPNRWSDGKIELIISAGTDFAINQIKKLLLLVRK